VETALRALLAECDRKGCPTLTRMPGGPPVVPRSHYRGRVDRAVELCGYPQRSELFRDLADRLGIPVERLSKAYYDRRLRFVPEEYCEAVDTLAESANYDLARVYEVGQRIRHPHFGTGVVIQKLRKNAIRVQLDDGGELLLREAYQHDPYRTRTQEQLQTGEAQSSTG